MATLKQVLFCCAVPNSGFNFWLLLQISEILDGESVGLMVKAKKGWQRAMDNEQCLL